MAWQRASQVPVCASTHPPKPSTKKWSPSPSQHAPHHSRKPKAHSSASLLYQSHYCLLRVMLSWLKSVTRRRSRRRMTMLMRRRILKMMMMLRRRRRRKMQGPLSLRQPGRLSVARSIFWHSICILYERWSLYDQHWTTYYFMFLIFWHCHSKI